MKTKKVTASIQVDFDLEVETTLDDSQLSELVGKAVSNALNAGSQAELYAVGFTVANHDQVKQVRHGQRDGDWVYGPTVEDLA